jgi:hypothetical protein
MAGVTIPDMRPWGRHPLVIPPNSASAWFRLAIWELWMGMLVCVVLGLGILLVASSPHRIVTVPDLTNCYAPPPVTLPCERIVYRGGVLNAAFTAACGLMLVGAALWFVWELWSAVEPKPITDDFLRLLNDSFGLDWHNPRRWPWARLFWAYGFTIVGAVLTSGAAFVIWTLLVSTHAVKAPAGRVETSEIFRPSQ